jgi:hypothetical protein
VVRSGLGCVVEGGVDSVWCCYAGYVLNYVEYGVFGVSKRVFHLLFLYRKVIVYMWSRSDNVS